MHTVTVVASFLAAAGLLAGVAPASAQGISISGPFEGEAKTFNAAGATFPAPLYQKWFDEYSKLTGVQVNYQPIGSGGGIKGIQDQTVDLSRPGATRAWWSTTPVWPVWIRRSWSSTAPMAPAPPIT
jgi:ABC-type phosphate transport system substrate-binding protein